MYAENEPSFWHRLDRWLQHSTLLSFEGRINRSTFWLRGVLPLVGLSIVSWIALAFLPVSTVGGIVTLIVAFLLFGMWLAPTVKRLHDRDKSMWWLLIWFIPIVGQLWLFIEVGFLEGTPGANRYGEKP
ncbi:MAG: DUF805 domain-containing protein [Dehalococcoidia bacterium]|nr:DUF805 domain-containing protein [Dehalococcoidia bacterium]